ncbi:hypothetical protein SETIT_4G140900v2, partial [Setaria italica]
MSYEEKQEKLKKRREAYHQQKREKCSQVTDQEKQQKIQKKCMHERERYANIQPNQKKAKLEQDSANRARRRDTLSKNSIAMENPANIATDNSQNVTQFATSIRHRKHVTPGEREALLAYRDEKLTAKTMGKTPATPDEDYSTNTKVIDDLESIKQPTNMKEGDDGVVYEEDTDEEDNIISAQDTTTMRNSGIYTFRAHEHRYRYCRKEMYEQDKHVLLIITNTLRNNPYSEQFRSLGQEENLEEYRVMLNLDQRLDQRTYNAPITSEVAAVWVEGNERRNTFDRNVILHGNNNEIQGIRSYAGCYDPLSYPLFFPRGELGWHADIPKVGITTEDVMKARANQNNKNNDPDSSGRMWVTMREYYCYKFHERPNIFNPILYGGRLFQQFVVDTYIKIESSRLDFIWNHQKEIRADLYQGLLDSIHVGQDRGDAVGKRTVLSSSFIGGPRDKMRRYLDAMALVRKYGKPDIFLTMTCNPNWEEITNELEFGQTPQDRPDLVVRVFRAKLEEMKKQLLEEHILGKVKAYTYVVEFQKRGLPHAHFLLIMTGKYKLTCPEQYDRLISVELPNKQKYPELYKMVIKHMMHGPCGTLNKNCACTKNRKSCKNYYPRPFNATTIQGKDSYPLYRRRDDGHNEIVRGHKLDNSEKEDIDEIRQYRDARWVTPPEALWRIYGFELSKTNPSVMQLQLHLPNMHMVSYHGKKEITEVINREGVEKSMLTAYFEANRIHEKARGILYRDFPEHYTWQTQGKFWQQRKRKTLYQVGRIISAHPAEGERYYLRVLLNHVKGATCYEDLRTVDGQILPSFREAAERRGVIEADNTLDDCLTEAELFRMPSSLRRLFATILVFCEPHDIRALWNNHIEAMSEDYRRSYKNARTVEQK